jgi:YD repeat-containing protein
MACAAVASGWYRVDATYWANGALNTLNMNFSGVPNWTYNVDGEGRPNTVSASLGQNPVTATAYNLYSSPPNVQVTLGSGDRDTFSFDANTGRMTQYKFTVGATPQNVVGNLTWNANGSLQQLQITDPFNSANTQTCKYGDPSASPPVAGYDDLSRLASANCGSAAAQTFSYDAFGNISKSGSPYSFQPTYYPPNPLTNRVVTLGGSSVNYDANGNLTSDTVHSFSWDAEGRPILVDGVGLTYDALGRQVEQSWTNGQGQVVYDQVVYDPTGAKLAYTFNQSLWVARR